MKITENFEIIHASNGTFTTIINGIKTIECEDERIEACKALYQRCKGCDEATKVSWYNAMYDSGELSCFFNEDGTLNNATLSDEEYLESGLSSLLRFFKEFDFIPSYRCVNTLCHALVDGKNKGMEYFENYFDLIDSQYKNDIREKMRSTEFQACLELLRKVAPTKTVNNRLKIYYGSQGTGKTTMAQNETENRCIVCNSDMTPDDLIRSFNFDDGKATFDRSILRECMEDGKAIVFDEINMLPFNSLRFLQGITDGKTEFTYGNEVIHIADGFQIIGTMNLTVNGMTFGLPEPLVDRCSEIQKFDLTAKQLMGAVI